MATTAASAFDEFKERLKLTAPQSSSITARRDATASYAKQAFPSASDLAVASTKLIGSAARETIIRPLDDIDLLVEFSNKGNVFETYRYDSQAFLYRVRDGLKQFSNVRVVGARGQAVRFFYVDAPHVDVAPVFRWSSGGYALPNGTGGWLTTDPDAHAEYIANKHRDLSYNLKPLVKMLKQWNRAHSNYLKSFHLEVMVANSFGTLGNNSRDACEKFFGWAQWGISVHDPAGHGGDLSSYLTQLQRQSVITNMESARQRAVLANQAEANGNHEEAIRLWRIVFGSEFPTYG